MYLSICFWHCFTWWWYWSVFAHLTCLWLHLVPSCLCLESMPWVTCVWFYRLDLASSQYLCLIGVCALSYLHVVFEMKACAWLLVFDWRVWPWLLACRFRDQSLFLVTCVWLGSVALVTFMWFLRLKLVLGYLCLIEVCATGYLCVVGACAQLITYVTVGACTQSLVCDWSVSSCWDFGWSMSQSLVSHWS